MSTKHLFTLSWNSIDISISLCPDYSTSFKANTGKALAHIEVKANEPLSISKTGYRSLFLPYSEVEQEGGTLRLIKKWLDEAANSREWKTYIAQKVQYSLFSKNT